MLGGVVTIAILQTLGLQTTGKSDRWGTVSSSLLKWSIVESCASIFARFLAYAGASELLIAYSINSALLLIFRWSIIVYL